MQTRHETLVDVLVERFGCDRGGGFARQLRHIPSGEMEDDRRFLHRRWPRPDAWVINREEHVLSIYEVEDTHPLPDDVLADWSRLWHFLDTYDWTMELFRVSRWGQVDEVSLTAVFIELHLGGHGPHHTTDHDAVNARQT